MSLKVKHSIVDQMPKRADHIEKAWEFYRKIGSPKLVVAPMVDQSELAFRMQTRKHKAELCYTPMLHAGLFVRDHNYRKTQFTTCTEDRPLVAQFCGHDPDLLTQAASLLQTQCDAVDINLGCPQGIAKRGRYGSFLLEEWELLHQIVWKMSHTLDVPVTCKIRVLPDDEDTLKLAKMLQDSGCSILTVHGRTKEMKKQLVGPVNYDIIKKIKQHLKIPVLSNGGIETINDIKQCLDDTGCDGVMVSEGLLSNPWLFEVPENASHACKIAREYIELGQKYGAENSQFRGHIMKILFQLVSVHTDAREMIASGDPSTFLSVIELLEKRHQESSTESMKVYQNVPTWYNRYRKEVESEEEKQKKQLKAVREADRYKDEGAVFDAVTSIFDNDWECCPEVSAAS